MFGHMTEARMPGDKRTTRGTSLIEVLVVIVVFLIGILAVAQIFPTGFKLLLLLATAALAVHARLRLIPNLNDDNLTGLAWHIRAITAVAIAFVVVGALIRLE